MKRLAIALFVLGAMVPALPAQQRPQVTPQRLQPNQPNRPNDPARANPNANPNNEAARDRQAAAASAQNANDQLLQALYVSEFQRQVGVNDELAARFRPILMQWLQQRRNVIARRNAAVTELRRLLSSGAPESEITRQIGEVDQAENQTRNAERRLVTQVDPMLTPAQQARFRLFQVDMEQRIRDLLDAAQGRQPGAAQPNNPPPPRANRPAANAPARETGRRAGEAKQR